jgi:GT2 family glycosyltransferase
MLAIVIPYYKLTFFENTLQSLANQTDRRFKVYIGDDASLENPVSLLEKYQENFEFIYHRFEENLGGTSLTKQWERCIALSRNEEWIMILGDDDVLGENVVETFYKNIEEIKLDITVVRFATQKIDKKNIDLGGIHVHPKIEKAADFLFRDSRSSLSEYVFKSVKIDEIGFKDFPLAWYSDVLAVLEFSDFKNIFTINEAIVYVRISDLSISGQKDNFKLKAKAKFDFYYYLLAWKLNFFSKMERKELIFMLNKCYINDKKKLSHFFLISKLYFKNFLIKDYFSFIKLIILISFKNNCK